MISHQQQNVIVLIARIIRQVITLVVVIKAVSSLIIGFVGAQRPERKVGNYMIKGKAKMEFGTGDIRLTPMMENGVGVLCCLTQSPTDYKKWMMFNDPEAGPYNIIEHTEVMLTFTNIESIKTVIKQLNRVVNLMDLKQGEPNDINVIPYQLNFDDFMKEEK